ncbi:MAG: 2-hydroxychromene-2-carboxylate isomerase [Kordiimonadaceae bacterium]|nr:2-hydroxychromene-2-carboxylate isomerase [Kordiimonadaceae bacterium]MBO6567943.1 2-hydroxychromene-2-carboxylate isomerase [Kordiimonadaceae bacterium]MBO6964327.1 2-hydroxychromene-2-carboxylate isomerase [Kordiimonadaceae bacterium]
MSKLEFWFDFGSPNAYFVHKVLPEIEERLGVEFQRKPALLGGLFKSTGNQAPWMAFAGIPAKMEYMRKEIMRFVRHHGVTDFKMNPHFPINTLLVMRGAVAAHEKGELPAYMDCIMAAQWEQEKDTGNPEVVMEVLAAAGFDAAYYQEKVQDPDIKAGLATFTQEAIDLGLFGMPTMVVGDEIFFGKDSLAAMEKEIELSS